MLDLYTEFKEVLKALEDAGIPYAVCGGIAFSIHTKPRVTVDMDFLISPEDIEKCEKALATLGYLPYAQFMTFADGKIKIKRLTKLEQGGGDIIYADFLLVDNKDLEEIWNEKEVFTWEGMELSIVSRKGLISLKKMRESEQDLLDIKMLEEKEDEE